MTKSFELRNWVSHGTDSYEQGRNWCVSDPSFVFRDETFENMRHFHLEISEMEPVFFVDISESAYHRITTSGVSV